MKSYDVSIDIGTEDSELIYIGFGRNKECEKAINSLSLSAVASLTHDIVRFIYESYKGNPYTGCDEIGTLSEFVRDMSTINFYDKKKYDKEYLE